MVNIKNWTTRQKLIVFVVLTSTYSCFASLAMIGPIFPEEAFLRGVSSSVQGLIVGIFSLAEVICTLFFGKVVPKFGCRNLLTFGLTVMGISHICFGLLDYLPYVEGETSISYIVLCLIVRIVLAVGASATQPTNISVIAKHFPEEEIMPLLTAIETMVGVAISTGPVVAGTLYDVGGFILPFAVMGVANILLSVGTFFIVPSLQYEKATETETIYPMTAVLKDPRSIMMLVSVVISGIGLVVFVPTLEPYLTTLNMSATEIGLVFCLFSVGYVILSPILPTIIKKVNDSRYIMLVGYAVAGIFLFAIGPSPIFGTSSDYRNITLILCSLTFYGVGQALMLIPTYHQFLVLLDKWSLPNNLQTFGIIAGAWNAALAVGDFIGATTAGIFYDVMGFQWAMTTYGIFNLCMMIPLALFVLYEQYGNHGWRNDLKDGEMKPLVSDASQSILQQENGTANHGSTNGTATNGHIGLTSNPFIFDNAEPSSDRNGDSETEAGLKYQMG